MSFAQSIAAECLAGMGTRRSRVPCLAVVAGLAIGIGLAPAAYAQYMVNSGGNPLAGGLSRENPYASGGRDFAAEAKYRNSVVFSQAPGGFSFRGRLGYSDPSDFVGRLGSNSLNSFRRNSELSTIAGQGIRRDQAIDAQNALSTGGVSRAYQPGRGGVNFGAFNTPRSGYNKPQSTQGASAALPSLSNSAASRSSQNAVRRDESLDRSYNVTNKLGKGLSAGARAPSSRNSGLSGTSAFSDSSRGGDVSDRLGLSGRSSSISSLDFGRSEYGAKLDGERTLANSAKSRGQAERAAGDSERSRTNVAAGRPNAAAGGRIDTSVRAASGDMLKAGGGTSSLGHNTSYDELRQKLDKLGATGGTPDITTRAVPPDPLKPSTLTLPVQTPEWQRRLDDLRSHLQKKDVTTRDRISLIDRSKSPSRSVEKKADPTERSTTESGAADGDKPLRSRIDPDTLKMIRDVSGRVDSLVSSDTSKRDFYTEHMKAGQKLLADRMYFDAEERFSRALSMKPADVSAKTGQIHAQIGAGLSLSAGQALRRLLAEHPETAGQRYAASLRPDAERTQRTIEQLRINIAGTGKLRREAALLLAYLGFQTSDVALAREGLDAMAQVASEDPTAKSDERLVDLLRGVWLDSKLYETPAPTPTPDGSPK